MKNKVTALGVYREQPLSPGKVSADATILDSVAAGLATHGWHLVRSRAEELLTLRDREPRIVLSMAQSPEILEILKQWEDRGILVINKVQAVRNCYRETLIELFLENKVPIPYTEVVPLDELEEIPVSERGSWWLKRGDVHAMRPGDVTMIGSKDALDRAVKHYRRYGIQRILIQEHVEGPVVKFYGIGRGRYFQAFLASTGRNVTDETKGLIALANRCAEILQLEIWGGDAVALGERDWVIIDFNDWPSFSPCYQSAADAIVRYCLEIFEGDYLELQRPTNG